MAEDKKKKLAPPGKAKASPFPLTGKSLPPLDQESKRKNDFSLQEIDQKLEFLAEYFRLGLPIIPIRPGTKEALTAYTREKPTLSKWEKWLKKWPGCGIALLTGEEHIALDIDQEDTSGLPSHWLQSALIKTPRPGWKVLFSTEEPIPSFDFEYKGMKLEIHGQGKYAILPPSLHPSGRRYEWRTPLEYEVLLPREILNFIPERKPLNQERLRLLKEAQYLKADCIRQVLMRGLEARERDKGLFTLAVLLKKEGWNYEKVEDFIVRFYWAGVGDKKDFTERQAREKAKSAFKGNYQFSCDTVKSWLPWAKCANCEIAKRMLSKMLEREAFILRVKEELKDPVALMVAFELGLRGLPYPVNKSEIAQATGLSRKTVAQKIALFQEMGLLLPEEIGEPLPLKTPKK